MFKFSTVKYFKKNYNKEATQFNKYYCLDCHSGEGKSNQLLEELNKYFILKNFNLKNSVAPVGIVY